MCKEISLAQLGTRARREVEYVSRTTGIGVIDGGVCETVQEIVSPMKARRSAAKVYAAPQRAEVSLVLTGRFSKVNRSTHVKKVQRKTS